MRLSLLILPFLAFPVLGEEIPKPTPTKADEPFAKSFSPANAAKYLDSVGVHWTRDRACITCHTNMPALMARPLLQGDEGWKEVREFLEQQVDKWPKAEKPPRAGFVIATGFALAFNDAQKTGKLHLATKAALDRMWDMQLETGEWNWLKCDWPPLEHDDFYGVTLAALAVAYAPGDYAKTEKSKAGIEKLKGYFKKNPAPDLHHAATLLWASSKIPGLMTEQEQKKTIEALKAKQHKDGGWSLPSLGTYKRRDAEKTPNDPNAPSDGYGTGYITFVLLQAGVKPTDPVIVNAVKWMKTNQRESGRWYTRSLNNDKAHYIANAGTAFCVLALVEAGEMVSK
jgi:squalene-hopene/tetraprenyl-beta-curcumene cyclase